MVQQVYGLYGDPCYGLDEHLKRKGDGRNLLRSTSSAHPGALQPGDWFVTGDRVLALPSEGGNGRVMVWLTGGQNGHHIDIAARLPIALAPAGTQSPPDRRCAESGHNPFRSSGFCASCGVDVEEDNDPLPEWAPQSGPWCLNLWYPNPDLGTFRNKSCVYTCFQKANHDGRCRDINGDTILERFMLPIGKLVNKDSREEIR